MPPSTDPFNVFERVFSGIGGSAGGDAKQLPFTTSVLDGVQEDFKRSSARLGAEDRQKLEAHLALVQEAAAGVTQGVRGTCQPPAVNETPGYYDDAMQGGGGTGSKIPEKGKVMTDLLVAALACDVTRVGTMQWSDSEAKFPLGFFKDDSGASLTENHHGTHWCSP